MTEDRKNLLLSVWEQMCSRRCPCGRCDCIDSDPVAIARRVFLHWSVQYRRLSVSATMGAKHHRSFARRFARIKSVEAKADAERCRNQALREEFDARRFARAAVRYERLSSGRHPFATAAQSEVA